MDNNEKENLRVVITLKAKSKAEAVDCLKKMLRGVKENTGEKDTDIEAKISVSDKKGA